MVDVICPPLSISSIVVSLWLAGCLSKSTLIGWREYYGGGAVGVDRHLCGAPSKREHLTQCCFNIGPPPTAMDQHWNNIGSSLRVCWESCPHFDTPCRLCLVGTGSTVLCVLVNEQHQIQVTYTILGYGHVDILWTYQGAKIKWWFWPHYVDLKRLIMMTSIFVFNFVMK